MESAMQLIELRNYRLHEGVTRRFIRYFEEHFLFSPREEGMHSLGQFEVVGQPDRFVWIRGFHGMQTRLRGLTAFYGGPFWLTHRSEANAMMLEHHDVHLLRPLGPMAALTGDAALEDTASEPPGTLPSDTGLVVADFYHAEPAALGRLVERFERHVQPVLVGQGHEILGHFVAELGRPTTIRGCPSSRTLPFSSSSPRTAIQKRAPRCGAAGAPAARSPGEASIHS
jgi:hypothetical protein